MAASFNKHKQSRRKSSARAPEEDFLIVLKETVEAEIGSRAQMVKLIEAELFSLRREQKDLKDTVAAIDGRIAKMIDFLNTFPDRVGRAVTAAMTGRGWGAAIPTTDPGADAVEFLAPGKIHVGGKPEISRAGRKDTRLPTAGRKILKPQAPLPPLGP